MNKRKNRIKFSQYLPKEIHISFILSYIITIIITTLSIAAYSRGQTVIPLFYSLPSSQDHLVNRIWIYALPTFSVLTNIINFLIIKLFSKLQSLTLKIMGILTVYLQIICLLIIIRLYLII